MCPSCSAADARDKEATAVTSLLDRREQQLQQREGAVDTGKQDNSRQQAALQEQQRQLQQQQVRGCD